MKTPRGTANRSSTSEPSASPAKEFKAFIAYADLNAARLAMRAINEVLEASPRPYRLQPMLWRYDQICSEKWRETSLVDGALADVVVLASSSARAIPATVEKWVGEFINQMRGTRMTLVALLGQDDSWTISIEGPKASRELAATMAFPAAARALVTRAA